MESNYQIDNIDRGILSELMINAKVPYTEIAKKLIVSAWNHSCKNEKNGRSRYR